MIRITNVIYSIEIPLFSQVEQPSRLLHTVLHTVPGPRRENLPTGACTMGGETAKNDLKVVKGRIAGGLQTLSKYRIRK